MAVTPRTSPTAVRWRHRACTMALEPCACFPARKSESNAWTVAKRAASLEAAPATRSTRVDLVNVCVYVTKVSGHEDPYSDSSIYPILSCQAAVAYIAHRIVVHRRKPPCACAANSSTRMVAKLPNRGQRLRTSWAELTAVALIPHNIAARTAAVVLPILFSCFSQCACVVV